MKNSIDILDAIAARHGGCSDYRIAKLTGIGAGKISAVRNGRCSLSRAHCKRAALALGVEAGALIAITQAEQEDDPEIRESLLRVAGRGLVAALALSVLTLGTPIGPQPKAATGPQEAAGDCLLCQIGKRRRRPILRLPRLAGLRFARQQLTEVSRLAA